MIFHKNFGSNFEILATVLNPKTRNESLELGRFIKIDFNDVNSVERRRAKFRDVTTGKI